MAGYNAFTSRPAPGNPFMQGATPPQGFGLQYKPLPAWQNVAGSGLQGLSGLLLALGAGQPQQAAAAFQNGLQGFDETQRARQRTAQDAGAYGMAVDDYQTQKKDKAEAKAAAAAQQAQLDAAIDAMNLPPDQKLALLNGLASYSDVTKAAEAPKTVGGMQFDPVTKTYVPIPGYTEQASAIAAAGRAPAQPREPVAHSLITMVGPDNKPVSVDSRDDAKIQSLLSSGYVQRESSMFPAPPTGYALTPTGLTPIPGGPADPANKPVTEDQGKARQLYERLVPQLAIVDKTFTALADPQAQAVGILPGSNYFQGEDYQRAQSALTDIAASYLYSVSGATANPGEVANLVQTITPVFGDKPGQLADKQTRIRQMVESVKTRAALPQNAQAPTLPNIPPPLPGFVPLVPAQ